MKSLLVAFALSLGCGSPAFAADALLRAYSMELKTHQGTEGSILVEQKYKGQSAYTLSYYIGERTLRTQVLLKSSFEMMAAEMKNAMPKVEAWDNSLLLQCQASASFASNVLSQKRSKRICFDALSATSKARFSEAYERLKNIALGRAG